MRMSLKKRSMEPESVHPTGQPSGAKTTYTGAHGQGSQPGHPHMALHNKTGVAKPTQTNVTTMAKPKTVRHMLRHGHGGQPTAPKMRAEGQKMHVSGQHHGGTSQAPYTTTGAQVKQPGKPEMAGKGSGGGKHLAEMQNLMQPRVPIGSKAGYAKLRPMKVGLHFTY